MSLPLHTHANAKPETDSPRSKIDRWRSVWRRNTTLQRFSLDLLIAFALDD
ncbi:hypothetical protein RRSWK_00417 [Rhodopirellula sp. SWK7]|nr:hypothetical protein RRSWK_00417 [Rhodopirellula sp. SWK7]